MWNLEYTHLLRPFNALTFNWNCISQNILSAEPLTLHVCICVLNVHVLFMLHTWILWKRELIKGDGEKNYFRRKNNLTGCWLDAGGEKERGIDGGYETATWNN